MKKTSSVVAAGVLALGMMAGAGASFAQIPEPSPEECPPGQEWSMTGGAHCVDIAQPPAEDTKPPATDNNDGIPAPIEDTALCPDGSPRDMSKDLNGDGVFGDCPSDAPAPKPSESEKPKPSETDKPKPSESEKPKPSESDKPKPSESEKPKPSESDKPKPSESEKPGDATKKPADKTEKKETKDVKKSGDSLPVTGVAVGGLAVLALGLGGAGALAVRSSRKKN
ncbi:hypothetical protein [Corynebacterium sp. H113]|uniref:hypothetical protein n=1 Tax=Corynebacterium sp. H113 TaxID=3133419 RepID=UPI003096FA1F